MADMYVFDGGDRVGLVVRGKSSHADDPSVFAQHADCILSNGSPVGFFGTGNTGSSGGGSSGSGGSSRSSANSSNSSGMGMTGVVYDATALGRNRANYVDLGIAQATKTASTVLLVQVSATEAAAFDKAWADMSADPGSFQLLGWNCSTHASQAFRKAGILSGGIPGLDTPNNLYKQLCIEKRGKVSVVSGYVGFKPGGKGHIMMVEAITP
jgi:hypothetical protein